MKPVILVASALIVSTASAWAQPTLPRANAPVVPASIRAFVDGLYSADAHKRAEAACEIGRRPVESTAAVPILLSMLGDEVAVGPLDCDMNQWAHNRIKLDPAFAKQFETSPAKEAAEALGDIGEPAVPGLLTALQHAEWHIRRNAASALGEADLWASKFRVVSALSSRLSDQQADVREKCAWALGEIEETAAVPALTKTLRDADARVRAKAAWALGEIEDASAVDGLIATLKDADATVRRQAAWALGEIESALAVPALSAALADVDQSVRKTAVWALGEIEDVSAVTALLETLADTDAEVRRQSAWALGEIEDATALAGLTRALKDVDWRVRKNAAWALGEIEDPRALSDLQAAAKDASAEVRRAVAAALRELRDRR